VPNLIAGIHRAIAARIYSLVNRLKIKPEVAITGGGAKNIGLVKELEAKFGAPVLVARESLITGALGAALIGQEIYENAAKTGVSLARKPRQLGEASFFS
jgi:activator of 2-hydroxyglutaryl-CoA dehydratase